MNSERMAQLEDRLGRLEDKEAIGELTARYSVAVNQGWDDIHVDFDALPHIFAQDATWESRAINVRAEGIDNILSGVRMGTASTVFAMHSYTNPVIRLYGVSAHAEWLLFIGSCREGGTPNLVFIQDEISYVRTECGWRIRSITRHFGMELVEGASSH